MNSSELHRIITLCKHSGRNVSEFNKKNSLEFYASHRIMLSLPFKKYAKNIYLRSTLGVAYEEYARKEHALGNRVLSQSAVYRCIKAKVRMRRRAPFKDCQCDECLNHGLLIDALIVADVKGISRRNTHNVLKSFGPMMGKECDTDERAKGTGRQLFREQNVVIQTINEIAYLEIANSVVVWDSKNQSRYPMKVWTGTKLLHGINGNMFKRKMESLRKMRENILIRLDTPVLWHNCLHYL